ncbi:MAG: hypothetical protein AMJ42_00945 [Deltaproteobacteria bacterium DG_8]|nr:MAG: hypothetical protein AMJ42_00945 [Deltaproteobacteria bacterium DG_8]
MKKKATKKKAKPFIDDKAKISKIVDEIISECSPLPDTVNLFSKIRELENSTIDYTTVLSKKFSKSPIPQQEFMIKHLLPHLKRFSLIESLNNVVQKETLSPSIIIDVLHYLIRSDTIIDHQLLENANRAEEIANQFSTLLEISASLESQDSITLFDKFCETPPSFQLGILMELIHLKGEKILPLLLKIFNINNKIVHKVIDLLGSLADKNSAHLLNQLLKETKDKELSKSIKKTLYRLKSKGIDVSPPKPVKTAKTERKKEPLPSPIAYVTTIDPLGERLILAIKPKSDQELTIFQFLISDQRGINDLIASITTSKDFKNYVTKIENNKNVTLVEIDLNYCHFLIKEASQKNHASGTRLPDNHFLWKKFFGKHDSNLDKAAIYTILNAEEIRTKEFLLQQSEHLIEKCEYAFWLLEWKFLVDHYKELYEAENSTLVLTEYQKESRINEIVKKTAKLFFDDKNRFLFRRRLEEIAYILWKTGKAEESQSAFVAALAFAPEGVPSVYHPFAIKTVEENFRFLKEQAQKEKRSKSGSIILP